MRYLKELGFLFRITPAVKYLILVSAGIFLLELFFHLNLSTLLGLVPANFWRGYLWQPVTYIFLHGSIIHLVVNMLILWMFGMALESTWGTGRFLKFFFICGIGAGLSNAVITSGSPIPIVGASGAIYGLLMAFGILFPEQLIYIWGIFPVKAKYFVIGVGIVEFLAAMSVQHSGIAHFAHLGGMLFGLVYMKWRDWLKSLTNWQKESRHRKELKAKKDREMERQRLQREVDRFLDKINREGLASLTDEDREHLDQVSSRMSELDRKES